MGRDLKIWPIISPGIGPKFSNEQLKFDRDEILFEEIKKLSAEFGFPRHHEGIEFMDEFEPIKTDDEGENIRSITAGDFSSFLYTKNLEGWKNKAIREYIKALPNNLHIVLYFC